MASKSRSTRTGVALVAAAALLGPIGEAQAVSRIVRDACRDDYFNYCGQYEVGSLGLRACMRKNQRRLSGSCVNALVSAGEATPQERARARGQRKTREAEATVPERYEPRSYRSHRSSRTHEERRGPRPKS